MSGGVLFVICVPTAQHEHVLRFGNIPLKTDPGNGKKGNVKNRIKLEVELRDKKRTDHVPITYLAPAYCNDAYNEVDETLIDFDQGFIPVEMILRELLHKLEVENAAWWADEGGKYMQVLFPAAAGERCETILHCLTQLGVGKRANSIINVIPCSVVHSSDNKEAKEDEMLRDTEESRRWRSFVQSVRSKLTVRQVVEGVRAGGDLSFDYVTLIITADSLAALGLVENNAPNIVAAMLVSPLMGPVMSVTFGVIIADYELVKTGFLSLGIGMLLSLIFGFLFGLILASTEMPWGSGDWPTEEMKSRGNVRSLWMGVLWALTSGTGVALALLQGSAGPLIGVAISASLLPPVGLFWALACIWLLHKDIKIPHIKGEKFYGNSSYESIYHEYIPIEFAVNGIVSACLTVVNVICIFVTAILVLKLKEVAAPYTSSPALRRFWQTDIRAARDSNRLLTRARNTGDDEAKQYMMDNVDGETDEQLKAKLEEAVREATDDETFRTVRRLSYQSHAADEISRVLGIRDVNSTSQRHITSTIGSFQNDLERRKSTIIKDIDVLDKIITSLLQLQTSGSNNNFHSDLSPSSKSLNSNRMSNISSASTNILPTIAENTNYKKFPMKKLHRKTDSWSGKPLENSLVRDVLTNLRKQQKPEAGDIFLTPKARSNENLNLK